MMNENEWNEQQQTCEPFHPDAAGAAPAPVPDLKSRVILAALRLTRALKRCPPDQGRRPFPPAVGRLLACVHGNPGVSSRELCEMLDLRPSSLSEMLARGEEEGWLWREPSQSDRRVQLIRLTPQGEKWIAGMEAARAEDAAKKASCFTGEEMEQFCTLCDRLSDHLEKLSIDAPLPQNEPEGPGPQRGREPRGFWGRGRGHEPKKHGPGHGGGEPRPPRPAPDQDPDRPAQPEPRPFPPDTRFRS